MSGAERKRTPNGGRPSGDHVVAIDATGWANPRGEGRYLRGVLPALTTAAPELQMRFLVEREHEAAIASRLGDSHELIPVDGSPGSRLSSGGSRRPADVRRLRAATRSTGARTLLQPSLVGWFPARVPQVLGVHDLKPPELAAAMLGSRSRQLAWATKERLALRSARAIFAVSGATRAAIAARTGTSPDAIPIAPPAIARAFRRRKAEEVAAARERVGLSPEDRYVVYLSGLNPHKDPAALVDAIARHRGAGGELRAVLAGSWEAAYEGIGRALRERSRELGETEAVRMPGHVDDDVLAALLCGCDALVSTSRHEGLGLPALEGAACGAPLVLSDIPPHRETSDGRAWFFPPGDSAALAALLARLPPRPAAQPSPTASPANRSGDPYDFSVAAEAIASLITSEPAMPGT